MERPYWKLEEELAVVNNVTLTADDVVQHAVKLFTNASLLCFAHGNIDQELVRTHIVNDSFHVYIHMYVYTHYVLSRVNTCNRGESILYYPTLYTLP